MVTRDKESYMRLYKPQGEAGGRDVSTRVFERGRRVSG